MLLPPQVIARLALSIWVLLANSRFGFLRIYAFRQTSASSSRPQENILQHSRQPFGDNNIRCAAASSSNAPPPHNGDELMFSNDLGPKSISTQHSRCFRCGRKRNFCVCILCKKLLGEQGQLNTRTRVTIFQDRDERFRKLGSAVIAERCLKNCDILWHDVNCEPQSIPEIVPEDPEAQMALLYPSRDSITLSEFQASNKITGGGKVHLIVLDSTWAKAKRMYKLVPWLAKLPAVKLDPEKEQQSAYGFRKQPHPGYLSTAECIAVAVQELEGRESGVSVIKDAFKTMVDGQIQQQSLQTQPRYNTKRRMGRKKEQEESQYR